MIKKRHDSFAKQYLKELLSPLGEVDINRELMDEARQVDILFSPASSSQTNNQSLGFLGKIVMDTSLLEVFRNQPSKKEVRNCLSKLLIFFAELERKARREETSLPEDDLPRLWILSPSASQDLLETFDAKLDLDNWISGIYFLSPGLRTAIVVINKLPVTVETLWLRILGRGEIQRQAVKQLLELEKNHPLRESILQLIANWRIITLYQENLTEEDQELAMELSAAYLEWEQTTLQRGEQRGLALGEQRLVTRLLNRRFGKIDSLSIERIRRLSVEQLESLGEALLDFATVSDLEAWLNQHQ